VINAAAARVIGRSHVASGRNCQDAVAVIQRRSAACIALADGAGSKTRSEIGAQVASTRAAKIALGHFDQLFALANSKPLHAARLILDPVLVALKGKNKRRHEPLDSLASTLLFAAYKEGRYVAGHLGDGVICIKQGPEVRLLSAPENGEYANSTYFVTDKSALTHFRLYAGVAGDEFGAILMSDGTAESLYERSTGRIGSAAQKILDWSAMLSPKRMEAVLTANLNQVFSRKSSDDCSIAVMTVNGPEFGWSRRE
jgi:hypothetical protein